MIVAAVTMSYIEVMVGCTKMSEYLFGNCDPWPTVPYVLLGRRELGLVTRTEDLSLIHI